MIIDFILIYNLNLPGLNIILIEVISCCMFSETLCTCRVFFHSKLLRCVGISKKKKENLVDEKG